MQEDKRSLPLVGDDPVANLPTIDGFPSSEKVYVEAEGLRVPFRRIHLAGGEPPFDVYDTTGPQGCDPRAGLPKLRAEWIARREQRGDRNFSQMHYARKGETLRVPFRRIHLAGG